jgi:hypothetical protein
MHLTDPVYRFLGVVASINRRLWLIRVNFIPLNVALMFGLLVAVVAGYSQLSEGLANQQDAAPQSLAVLLSAGRPTQDYVAVQGKLFTDARLEYGTEGSDGKLKRVEKRWAPLLDSGTGKVLLVQLARSRPNREEPEDLTIKGMLRPMPPNLHNRLASSSFMFAGAPVESRFMLVEGQHPEEWSSGALLAVGCGLLLVAFAAATFWRNVVFRKDGPAADALAAIQSAPELKVSGRMFLNEKISQHFANMPAAFGTLESGELAMVSNIDASSRFMGVKTSDRSGLWTIAIVPGSVTDSEAGHVFWGFKKWRAVRFRYVNRSTGRHEQVVVATA